MTRFIKNFFNLFIFRKKQLSNVRKITFGLLSRYLGLFTLVIFIVLFILTLIIYVNYRSDLEMEKNAQTQVITKLLSRPSEFYLDKDLETTREEKILKYTTIKDESENFKKYNPDIIKIFLTNSTGRIVYSTYRKEIGRKRKLKYITKSLNEDEEKLNFHDYEYKDKEYRAITYPIFLRKGMLIHIIKDFKKDYDVYHQSKLWVKRKIYKKLWNRYKEILGEEFNPKTHKKENGMQTEIFKAWDVDFMFLKLFSNVMKNRNRRIKRGEAWLWKNSWLYKLKRSKLNAYVNDMSAKANKINELIKERFNKLFERVKEVRKLGVLAVTFDLTRIKKSLGKNIKKIIVIALIVFIICTLIFFVVISYMLMNIKFLERWALNVSGGNLNEKVEIKTKDEIGRLSDVFNNMIDEIKVKFHLEKYVSDSTKSMIDNQKHNEMETGKVERKDLAFIFSDVRGFTSFSEKNDPETVMEVLNLYLNIQAKVITKHNGDIDDYVGDEIMAHFSGVHKEDTAIATSIDIIKEINKLNKKRLKENLPIFEVGIGVHCGEVVIGNIGTDYRMDFACIGDTVNLTSRLCSSAKAGEILISKNLIEKTSKKHDYEKLEPIEVKGKAEKIEIVKMVI